MTFDAGDTVAVPFPFVDMNVSKRRPALVLSSHVFNERNRHTILAMITTAANSSWPSDCEIRDGEAAGLNHRSFVRWKVFTLENSAIVKQIGRLTNADLASVRAVAPIGFAL